MADAHDNRPERRPRAANASYWDKLKQANDAKALKQVLERLASGLRLLPHQTRWVESFPAWVRDAIMACEQKDSRFLPAPYLRNEMADPLPREASQADRDDRLRQVNLRAYRGREEQRAVAEEALAVDGVPKAVAAIASTPVVPASVESMEAALAAAVARLMARADEAAERELSEAGQRTAPAVLQEAWVKAEQRAARPLPKIEDALRERRTRSTSLEEQRGFLEWATREISFSEEAERVAKQHGVPGLAQHLLAMRDAVAAEYSARLVSVEQPGRVPGADAAWAAMAKYHGVSVATLRKRGPELPRPPEESAGQKQHEDPKKEDPKKTDRLAPKKPRRPDHRRRSGRQLGRNPDSRTAGRSANKRSDDS